MPLSYMGSTEVSQASRAGSSPASGTFGTIVGSKDMTMPLMAVRVGIVSGNWNTLPTVDQSKQGYLVPSPA